MTEADRESLRSFLSTRDAPCLSCTYNLRGVQSPACPECGAPLDLRKLHQSADWHAWRESRLPEDRIVIAGMIGAIVGMAWPAGLVVLLVRSWSLVSSTGLAFRAVLIATGLCHCALFWLFISRTHRVAARPPAMRWTLTLAAWFLGPIMAITIGAIALSRMAAG